VSDDKLFDELRAYAKDNVVRFWGGGFSKTRWTEDVKHAALRINADLAIGHSGDACEAKAVSVADYFWRQLPKRARVTEKGTVVRY
jgi:hypothetical protein